MLSYNFDLKACETKLVTFTDASTPGEGNINQWLWNLGDGTATGANLTYKWTPAVGLDDPALPTPKASPQADTKYTLTVTLATAAYCAPKRQP